MDHSDFSHRSSTHANVLDLSTSRNAQFEHAAASVNTRNSSRQYLQFHGDQIRENTTGFAKMFFIIANVLLFIFYIVCFAKCKYYDKSVINPI